MIFFSFGGSEWWMLTTFGPDWVLGPVDGGGYTITCYLDVARILRLGKFFLLITIMIIKKSLLMMNKLQSGAITRSFPITRVAWIRVSLLRFHSARVCEPQQLHVCVCVRAPFNILYMSGSYRQLTSAH